MEAFQFKQFSILQNQTAMKVGTDGVLLGSWALDINPLRMLDIGTGTGLLSLMMAQRFPDAFISGIEIDATAYYQSLQNVMLSKWPNRIQMFHSSLEEWMWMRSDTYDMIICNPPYFSNGWTVEDAQRKLARDATYLPAEQLIKAAQQLLNPKGSLQLILPAFEGLQFMHKCRGRLWCRRYTTVFAKEGHAPKRLLLDMVLVPVATMEEDIIIEHNTFPTVYTDAYKSLTSDFYLHF